MTYIINTPYERDESELLKFGNLRALDQSLRINYRLERNLIFLPVLNGRSLTMTVPQPKTMVRASAWNDEVEEAYRFQVAGFRDEREYKHLMNGYEVERWPHNGYVKKLKRKDGCFYYYNKCRECPEKDIPKTKLYAY